MPKRPPVEKRFDVCSEIGEVLAFSVAHHMAIWTFGLSLADGSQLGDVISPSHSMYRFVRVQ